MKKRKYLEKCSNIKKKKKMHLYTLKDWFLGYAIRCSCARHVHLPDFKKRI